LVSRQVICGAGRVGIGADGRGSGFQISQRADFFEVEVGLELLQGYRSRDSLGWDHPRLQLVDLQYSDMRLERGLYNWLAARNRMVRLTHDAAVDRAIENPPEDTRAYFRGRCLRRYPESVAAASWDSVIFDIPGRESLQRVLSHPPGRAEP
jgi:Pup amidohydrolase